MDDVFAVKLALQLGQNENVNLTITSLKAAADVSSEDAYINDTSFQDLKAHGTSLATNMVQFSSVDTTSLPDAFLTGNSSAETTLFIVGRSVIGGTGPDLSRVQSADGNRTVGGIASDLIGKIKSFNLDAGVLVVQEKVN